MGHLDDNMMIRVDNAITISFGLSKQDVDYISKKYEGSTASGNEAIQKNEASITAVSYTHLDVYKRQYYNYALV